MKQNRLLLTGVFGPFGITNEYAEGRGMQMELMNNQITRMQGVHSQRGNFLSFGLYMIAENISVPTTVLDFPRESRKYSTGELPQFDSCFGCWHFELSHPLF